MNPDSPRRLTWKTWAWITSAFLVILSSGLAAGWLLERYDSSRGFEVEADRIADVLGVQAGFVVGDVIAGTGKWSIDLARRVGPRGRVYATEFAAGSLAELRRAVRASVQRNVTVLTSTEEDTGLTPSCCDGLLVRAVYHHFQNRSAMVPMLVRAVRPGGLVAVIDFDDGTAEQQSGHGIARHRVQAELTAAGLELVRDIEDWNGHAYCLLFRRPSGPTAAGPGM